MANPAPSNHVLIATPSYDERFTHAYTKSLFALQKHFQRYDLETEFEFLSLSTPFIDMTRNIYASCILEEARFTHLLFIDHDHGYPPQLIADMLKFDKPITGVVYPARTFDFDNFLVEASKSGTEVDLRSLAVRFVRPPFVANEHGKVDVVDGFARVSKLGTGIMLIKREVFERLSQFPELMATGYRESVLKSKTNVLLQCFRPIIGPDNLPISEDVSFCMRWTELCGGEIWANIVHETSHTGLYEYKGKFIDRLMRQAPPPADR